MGARRAFGAPRRGRALTQILFTAIAVRERAFGRHAHGMGMCRCRLILGGRILRGIGSGIRRCMRGSAGRWRLRRRGCISPREFWSGCGSAGLRLVR